MKYLFSYLALFLLLVTAVSAGSIMPVKCNDNTVVMTDEFADGDDICVYGTGFAPETQMDLYVVAEQDNYTDGLSYVDLSGAVEQAEVNAQGTLRLWKIWENVKQGFYDFIADLNRDGRYDAGDVVNAATYTPDAHKQVADEVQPDEQPVEEVPEFGTLAAFFLLIGIGIFISRRKKP